jgi:hypothetical protein
MREVVDAEALARPRTQLERMLGIRALSPDARRAFDVALGDAAIAPALQQLGPRWDMLHDVPIADSRAVDHVAIGPGGVYAIRAVHCGGADVIVDGPELTIGGAVRGDLVELAESATIAEQLLETARAGAAPADGVTVRPLFVAVDAGRIVVRTPAPGVGVIGLSQLRRTLAHARPRLPGDAVASISDLAERSSTWPAGSDDDAAALRGEFQQIRDRVTVALRRRTGWAIGVFGVGAVTMFAAIAGYVTWVVLA